MVALTMQVFSDQGNDVHFSIEPSFRYECLVILTMSRLLRPNSRSSREFICSQSSIPCFVNQFTRKSINIWAPDLGQLPILPSFSAAPSHLLSTSASVHELNICVPNPTSPNTIPYTKLAQPFHTFTFPNPPEWTKLPIRWQPIPKSLRSFGGNLGSSVLF